MQIVPQSIPDGDPLTLPLPAPALLTVRAADCRVNVAATAVEEVRFTVQGPVPLHAPLHPAKVEPVGTTAVRLTEVPYG